MSEKEGRWSLATATEEVLFSGKHCGGLCDLLDRSGHKPAECDADGSELEWDEAVGRWYRTKHCLENAKRVEE
jgi:hypothetical protein